MSTATTHFETEKRSADRSRSKLVPALRFKEFDEEWTKKDFGSIVEKAKTKHDPQKSKEEYPCIEMESIAKESSILLEIFNSKDQLSIKNKFNKGEVLFGKLRPNLKKYIIAPFDGVCSSEIWVLKGKKLSNEFLFRLIQTNKFYSSTLVTSGSKMPRADWAYISSSIFPFPHLPEQHKIASFLSAVDEKVQKLTIKKALLEQYKKGVMQQLFSGQLRFKDENGNPYPDWEPRKMSDVLFEHKLNSTGNEEVFSVSVHKGLVNQVEHLGRVFAAKNTDNYNLVQPGDIVYTKSPTGSFPLGIIKQSKIDENVIVSPLYGIFTPETEGLGYIFNVFFESPINVKNYLASIIQKGAKNTINITNTTFLSKKMKLPISKEEQQRIGDFLKELDIKTLKINNQITQSQTFKKGLLQQMFV